MTVILRCPRKARASKDARPLPGPSIHRSRVSPEDRIHKSANRLKGLTPIPSKIVTITSGFAGYNLVLFVLLSFIARGGRFFLIAFLLNRYGVQARIIIEERLGFWVACGAIVLVIGIMAALYLF